MYIYTLYAEAVTIYEEMYSTSICPFHSLGREWLRVGAGFDLQVLQLLQGLWNCKYKGLLVIKLPNSNIFITAKHKSKLWLF